MLLFIVILLGILAVWLIPAPEGQKSLKNELSAEDFDIIEVYE